MDWLPGYAAGLDGAGSEPCSQFDLSYLMGRLPVGERHEPHVHDQQKPTDPGFLVTLELVRDRKTAEQS
jgi:hypothetical protein